MSKELTRLNQLKDHKEFVDALGNYFTGYDKAVAKTNCDKYGSSFVPASDKFVSWKIPKIMYSQYTGYYGSSSCSTCGCIDEARAGRYFLEAINAMQREIIAKMHDLAAADLSELAAKAALEMKELNEMYIAMLAHEQQEASDE